jgi:phage terminase small subunit
MARGGVRAGAGRPKGTIKEVTKQPRRAKAGEPLPAISKPPTPEPVEEIDPNLTPLDHFLKVIRDPLESKDRRDRAAAVLLPFCHEKAGAKGGKKEEREDAAKKAASGKYAVPVPPRLVQGGKA